MENLSPQMETDLICNTKTNQNVSGKLEKLTLLKHATHQSVGPLHIKTP